MIGLEITQLRLDTQIMNILDKLDRNLQNKILLIAYESYPARLIWPDLCAQLINEFTEFQIQCCVFYLANHQLLEINAYEDYSKPYEDILTIKITHNGIDFIRDDGGLTAILKVMTVQPRQTI